MAGFFKRLLGGGGSNDNDGDSGGSLAEPVVYNGYVIQPQPKQDGGQWNIAGVITREDATGGEHRFIRADTYTSRDDADAFSIRKARQIIDEQGDRLIPKE